MRKRNEMYGKVHIFTGIIAQKQDRRVSQSSLFSVFFFGFNIYFRRNPVISIETLSGISRAQILLDHPKNTSDTTYVKVDLGEPKILQKAGEVIT